MLFRSDVQESVRQSTCSNIVVMPISFVSECIETLHELDIELQEVAEQASKKMLRVPLISDKSLSRVLEDIIQGI